MSIYSSLSCSITNLAASEGSSQPDQNNALCKHEFTSQVMCFLLSGRATLLNFSLIVNLAMRRKAEAGQDDVKRWLVRAAPTVQLGRECKQEGLNGATNGGLQNISLFYTEVLQNRHFTALTAYPELIRLLKRTQSSR